jgi:hypothetical protein
MARKLVARPEVATQQPYLEGVAKYLADKLYGPNGPPRDTKFLDLEELAVQLGNAISQELLNRTLARQAAAPDIDPSDEGELCPTCHEPGAQVKPEPRTVTTRVGDAEWNEPQRHCPRCRRSFFPSVPKLGD